MEEEGPIIKRFKDHTLKLHASKASPLQKKRKSFKWLKLTQQNPFVLTILYSSMLDANN